ncbi:MAG: DUF559 domain-containing protein [Acidithiobacillus sp.]
MNQLCPATQRAVRDRYPDLRKVKPDNRSPHAEQFGRLLRKKWPEIEAKHSPIHGRKIRIDYALVAERVAIEIDGYRPHGLSKKGFASDRQRQNLLVIAGWQVLRYTIRDIRLRAQECIEEIERLLDTQRGNGGGHGKQDGCF